jgi:hypothetical protein
MSIPLSAIAPPEMANFENAAWAGPETAAWAHPSHHESAGWAGPMENPGHYAMSNPGHYESAAWEMPMENPGHYAMSNPGHYAMSNPGHYETGDASVAAWGTAITKVLDPISGMIKWFDGGKEISQMEAQAKLQLAQSQQYMATAKVLEAKNRTNWTVIAMIAGAVAVAFFILRK